MRIIANRVLLPVTTRRSAAAVRAPAASPAPAASKPAADPVAQRVRQARSAGMEGLLASLARPPSSLRAATLRILQDAERKLLRLKEEARSASGGRRAALRVARELVVIARQIADAAQDYAVAQAQPDLVSPALAKAAARMKAEASADAGGTVDAAALAGEVAAAVAEATAIAAAPEKPDAVRPAPAEPDSHQLQQTQDQGLAPGNALPPGAGGTPDEGLLGKARRLFEEAVELLRAMEDRIGRRSARTGRPEPAEPVAAPVWTVGSLSLSAGAAQPAVGPSLPLAAHGR
jgi:hypothetical protein